MPKLWDEGYLAPHILQRVYVMGTSLVFNTDRDLAPKRPQVVDAVSHHLQAAMEAIRLQPCGDLRYEKHMGQIYHHLYEAMNLVVNGPPRAPSVLDNDLAAVMGGVADGISEVPQVPGSPTSSE
jgi:hypothetical protein